MRVDRLLAMSLYLMDRPKTTATELAEHFGASVRTIYRDIEALSLAGVPIVAESGPGGGYSLMENFTIHKGFLKPQEVLGLLGALSGLGDTVKAGSLSHALDKIRAFAPRAEAPCPPPALIVSPNPWAAPQVEGTEGEGDRIGILRRAIEGRNLVEFSYLSMRGPTLARQVEPYSLALGGSVWYLHAFCLLRGQWRLFRLSRISRLRALGAQYDPLARLPAPSPWLGSWQDGDLMRIRLRFAPDARIDALDNFSPECLCELGDGSLEATMYWPESDPPIRFILGLGSRVEALEPDWLRADLAKESLRLASLYRANQEKT